MSRFSNLLPQRLPAGFADRVGRTVAKTGLTPNMLSCIGLAGNVVAAVLVARGELLIAAFVFLFFSVVDLLDGSVARATGRATPFGAVLDAVFDRLGEGIVLCGIAWYFAERGENVQVAVTFAAMLGGVSVSYLRARAEIDGMVLGKPRDEADARAMLQRLSGREHRVFSGLCLWPLDLVLSLAARPAEGLPAVRVAITRLQMDRLTGPQLEEYLASGQWEGKAGAFGYQDRLGWVHVIEGSESNVVGLPMETLAEMLPD